MEHHITDDGHYIDDPMYVVNVKPDFEGLGLDIDDQGEGKPLPDFT